MPRGAVAAHGGLVPEEGLVTPAPLTPSPGLGEPLVSVDAPRLPGGETGPCRPWSGDERPVGGVPIVCQVQENIHRLFLTAEARPVDILP